MYHSGRYDKLSIGLQLEHAGWKAGGREESLPHKP